MKKNLLIITFFVSVFGASAQSANTWVQKVDFGGAARNAAVGFSIGTKGYVGTGVNVATRMQDFWEYDPILNTWTQKANFGGSARSGAVGFSIGTKGYIGTGSDSTNSFWQDFWEYDPIFNTWTQKANFGGSGRTDAIGFSIGNKGYIGTGLGGCPVSTCWVLFQDFWEYDQVSNAWTQKANFGGGFRWHVVGFNIGAKGYVGLGSNSIIQLNDFWEFDPATNLWIQKANYAGIANSSAIGINIGIKGYVGTGVTSSSYLRDFWEYNTDLNNWTQKADFGGTARAGSIGFSIDTKGYIGLGYDGGSNKKDFWEYITVVLSTGTISRLTICAGETVAVPYTAGGTFNAGNIFTAQLSNANGSFNSPINIGSSSSTSSGIINAVIPGNIVPGTSYRIRVISTSPTFTGSINESDITLVTITPGIILPLIYCIGETISVPCSTTCAFSAGNIFTAQLSSASGSFTSPINIGTLNSTTSGTINATIPLNTEPGVAYRIRVISSIPATTGSNNGNDITIGTIVNTDHWSPKTNFGGTARDEAVGFSIGTKGYIGTGGAKDFWEYNSVSNAWTQKADFGGTARSEACGFSIGNKGYIGTGIQQGGGNVYLSDFWEYDPSANNWTQKLAYGTACRNAVAFSIGSKGYIGTGRTSSGNLDTFKEYDPATNTWSVKANMPGGVRQGASGFSIGSKGYAGTGDNSGSYKFDFYEYDPASNIWTTKANFIGSARSNAVGFNIGFKGYIGIGKLNSSLKKDFYEYDVETNLWTQKADGPGPGREGACAFSIESQGYLGTGNSGTALNDFNKYEPDPSIQTESLSPLSYCAGSSLNVSYSVLGTYQCGDIFTAQLSNAGGSFISPINIGSLPTDISGTIIATIPANTVSGTGYRIRVVSANPSVIGSNVAVTVITCIITVNLKTFFESFFIPGTDSMHAVVDPVNYPGVCDSITCSLADSASLQIVATNKNVINTHGAGVFTFADLLPGHRYYLVIRHRNSLETWSKNSFLFDNPVLNIDFTH